jgi:hypothetical protein
MKINIHFKHNFKAPAIQPLQLIEAELTKRGIMLRSSNARLTHRFSGGWKVTCLGRRSTCSCRRPEQTLRVPSDLLIHIRKDL